MTDDPFTSNTLTLSTEPESPTVEGGPAAQEALKFGLTKLVLNQDRFVPISKDLFEKITTARDCLLQLVVIEEKFDFVVENLAALERAVLEAADLCKTSPIATVEFQITKSGINRHVANLVALGRMFIEQSLVHVEKLDALAGGVLFDLAGARTKQYDARLGYQLFEELRNYMLHRGSAVHSVEYHTAKEYDTEGTMTLRHKVSVYTSAAKLAEDRKFKKRVSAQLEASGDRHDLIVMARDYVAGLWDAQLEYRSALANFVSGTKAAYIEGAYLYAELSVEDELPKVVALAAVAIAADRTIRAKTPIAFDLIAQREYYEEKNSKVARSKLG